MKVASVVNMEGNSSLDIVQKVNDLKQDCKEHKLVLDTFKGLEPTRKCFQLVGGVLIEGTVATVEPLIADSLSRIEKFIENMEQTLQKRREQQNEKPKATNEKPKPSKPIR